MQYSASFGLLLDMKSRHVPRHVPITPKTLRLNHKSTQTSPNGDAEREIGDESTMFEDEDSTTSDCALERERNVN